MESLTYNEAEVWSKEAAILNLPLGYLEALGELPEGAITEAKSPGFEGVAMISIDAEWTALRFRPADKIGQKRKN